MNNGDTVINLTEDIVQYQAYKEKFGKMENVNMGCDSKLEETQNLNP